MKLTRDMNLIFELLKKIVDSEYEEIYCRPIKIDDYKDDVLGYHLYLMDQAGLIEASVPDTTMGPDFESAIFIEMKWEGYEFLDALKNDTVFKKFKSVLAEKGKEIPFKVAQELLLKISTNHFLMGFG
jgi:hypothetical protein